MKTCPCGFTAPAGADPWSPEWHRGHRDAHLAAFPDVDSGTRSALDQMVTYAEQRKLAPLTRVGAR